MSITGLNVLGLLKTKMLWHQDRQRVLAENVANADTPGFKARELRMPDFGQSAVSAPASVVMASTNPLHQAPMGGGAGRDDRRSHTFEITPEGNSVVLEEEILKVGQNAMDHQMVSQLYSRSIGLLRKAISRPA